MKSIINILSLFITSFAMANIHLPAIFADRMVLQRNAEVTIWGNADPREEITLKADFLDKEYKVKAINILNEINKAIKEPVSEIQN